MKLPNWFKIVWWIILLIVVSVFLCKRYPYLTAGNATPADIFIFLIWVVLWLLPLFQELSFFGMTFKKEVEQLKSDFEVKIESLRADIKNIVNVHVSIPSEDRVFPKKEEKPPKRNAMEYKILNTLWTKQVNKYPTFSPAFSFVISSNSPEYLQFREAGGKLIGEGLISETDTGYYHLTSKGWNWCKENHNEFPPDQWWPEEHINKGNLNIVLKS